MELLYSKAAALYIVTCYATEDAVQIVNSFYLQLH
jgi:hypothetical protein